MNKMYLPIGGQKSGIVNKQVESILAHYSVHLKQTWFKGDGPYIEYVGYLAHVMYLLGTGYSALKKLFFCLMQNKW